MSLGFRGAWATATRVQPVLEAFGSPQQPARGSRCPPSTRQRRILRARDPAAPSQREAPPERETRKRATPGGTLSHKEREAPPALAPRRP